MLKAALTHPDGVEEDTTGGSPNSCQKLSASTLEGLKGIGWPLHSATKHGSVREESCALRWHCCQHSCPHPGEATDDLQAGTLDINIPLTKRSPAGLDTQIYLCNLSITRKGVKSSPL